MKAQARRVDMQALTYHPSLHDLLRHRTDEEIEEHARMLERKRQAERVAYGDERKRERKG